jgi:hypothetical protein
METGLMIIQLSYNQKSSIKPVGANQYRCVNFPAVHSSGATATGLL